jgi:hypothetical protein
MWYFSAFFFSAFLARAFSISASSDLIFRSCSILTSAESPSCIRTTTRSVSQVTQWHPGLDGETYLCQKPLGLPQTRLELADPDLLLGLVLPLLWRHSMMKLLLLLLPSLPRTSSTLEVVFGSGVGSCGSFPSVGGSLSSSRELLGCGG